MSKDLQAHDDVCPLKIVSCKNNWGVIWERLELEQHYQLWELEPIQWTYYEFGWEKEIIRKNFDQHLKDFVFEHSLFFVNGQRRKNKEIDELK